MAESSLTMAEGPVFWLDKRLEREPGLGYEGTTADTWMNATLGFFEGQRKLAREYYAVDPEFAESYAGKVAGAVGAAVPQLVAMRVPVAAVVGIGGQSFLHAWEDAENTAMRRGEEFDPNRAYAYATTMAALNTALTFLEFDKVLGPWRKGQSELLGDNLIKLFQSATGAGAVNAVQGGVNDLGATAFGIETRNPFDPERRWDDFSVGTGAGIVLGAGARVALANIPETPTQRPSEKPGITFVDSLGKQEVTVPHDENSFAKHGDGKAEVNEPPAPYGVSKEGAKVLAFNADPKADWERALVVRSTGKEIFGEAGIPQGSKLKGILAVIREWGERSGLFAKHQTPALGAEVQITPNSIVNDLSHWAGREKVVSVAALPELLGQAVYIQTQEISTQPGLKHYILAAKLEIDGVPHMVSIVVRESNGHLFYDHEIVEKDKGESSAATPIGTNTRGGLQDDSPSVGNVVRKALGVKPKSGATGEAKPAQSQTPPKSPYRDESGGLILGRPISTKKDPASAETEARFLTLANDPQTADRIYDSLPDSYGGKVINPDTAREILPEYRNREGRMENTIATGGVASAYAKDRFWHELSKGGVGKIVVLTSGGPGAGKSTLVRDALSANCDLLFDGTLRDVGWAKESIDLALRNGWTVSVDYIQRPLSDVQYGVIMRADETGRWFPLRALVDAHVAAQRSIIEISKHYRGNDNVKIRYFVGTTSGIKETKLEDIDRGGLWNYVEESGKESENSDGRKNTDVERERLNGIETMAIKRRNLEEFRRVVGKKVLEERLLRYLARGDEGLLKLIGEVYGQE